VTVDTDEISVPGSLEALASETIPGAENTVVFIPSDLAILGSGVVSLSRVLPSRLGGVFPVGHQ
jgi:hypothetical protein